MGELYPSILVYLFVSINSPSHMVCLDILICPKTPGLLRWLICIKSNMTSGIFDVEISFFANCPKILISVIRDDPCSSLITLTSSVSSNLTRAEIIFFNLIYLIYLKTSNLYFNVSIYQNIQYVLKYSYVLDRALTPDSF